jgi:hypothetical protein
MYLYFFLNWSISKAFKKGQKVLIVPCPSLAEAFFLKEDTAKKLKGFGSIFNNTDLSLLYSTGLKLVFSNKSDVSRQKQIHTTGVVINYLKIKDDYFVYSLISIALCLSCIQAFAIISAHTKASAVSAEQLF